MSAGEARVGSLGAAVGRLHGAEDGLLHLVGAVLVKKLVGLTQIGQGEAELVDRTGYVLEDLGPRFLAGIGHDLSLPTALPVTRRAQTTDR